MRSLRILRFMLAASSLLLLGICWMGCGGGKQAEPDAPGYYKGSDFKPLGKTANKKTAGGSD